MLVGLLTQQSIDLEGRQFQLQWNIMDIVTACSVK